MLMLDLTPAEEARLQEEASRQGVDLTQYVRQRLGLGSPPDAENQALLDLLHEWEAEDAAMTEEEAEAAEADWQELKANLNANRKTTGERPLFP
ncbi:MAG TPA: hypothetical protein VFA07_12435 [Chthonomonadaceae bacterium]|nr:hypothetical protein [Chthonomonadaceae bacterium]